MIANVFLDGSNSDIFPKKYIQYLIKLETLNYLKKEKLIDNCFYEKAKVQIKKSHIC